MALSYTEGTFDPSKFILQNFAKYTLSELRTLLASLEMKMSRDSREMQDVATSREVVSPFRW